LFHADGQTLRQTDRHSNKHSDRQTNRHSDRQTDSDRQTLRQTDVRRLIAALLNFANAPKSYVHG
jgi:Fe-S-cluster formation regulator IscX/YfhJ